MSNKKKGQVQITFNWIYVLIAGAVIMLFFVGLIVKQKDISEDRLSGDVVRIMESIFTGAQVSEQTKNVIKTGGLSGKTLFFKCEEGVGEYGIKGFSARTQNSFAPIFSPPEISSSRLILWSVPYKLPFKISDFLFLTSPNVKYFLLGDRQRFAGEFIAGATDENQDLSISVEKIEDLSKIGSFSKGIRVRIVDLLGTTIVEGAQVPDQVTNLEDKDVTAISFVSNDAVTFFMKSGVQWRKLNVQPLNLISLGEKRDAVKYGAIFSEDPSTFMCNMQKAFQRASYLGELYEKKSLELKEYYGTIPRFADCEGFVSEFTENEGNIIDAIVLYKVRASICSKLPDSSCKKLVDFSSRIKKLNVKLEEECPVTLY